MDEILSNKIATDKKLLIKLIYNLILIYNCEPYIQFKLIFFKNRIKNVLNKLNSRYNLFLGANSMASSCICNQHEILKLLKSYSKGTEIKDDTAWTQHPVLFAAASGSKDCVKYLYDQDSNCINLTNKISGHY